MITLRDYQQSDVERLQLLANNINVTRYMTTAFPYPYTHADAEWWISTGCKEGVIKVIEYNRAFVGSVGAARKSGERSRTAVIGYWLGEPYWGKGIACRALKMLTAQLLSTTDIVRLEASIFSPNVASMKVAEKAGYKKESILEKAIFKNNEFYDEHVYSKLKQSRITVTNYGDS